MKPTFVKWGFYWDIAIPWSRTVVIFDAGWRRIDGDPWLSIWSLGWDTNE